MLIQDAIFPENDKTKTEEVKGLKEIEKIPEETTVSEVVEPPRNKGGRPPKHK